MKKILVVLSIICSFTIWAETEIKTDIKSVTRSLNGAQVFRKGCIVYNKSVNIDIENKIPNCKFSAGKIKKSNI